MIKNVAKILTRSSTLYNTVLFFLKINQVCEIELRKPISIYVIINFHQ